ncbi:MAG: hypothetical protein AAGJ93_15395 [Bacteroidota bacterium]
MLFSELSPTTRLWIYQANEPFATADLPAIEASLQSFASEWVSHNNQLKTAAAVLHDRFVVLGVDESRVGASGCSIDSSVRFLKSLGAQYQRDLFDRMRFSYESNGSVYTVSKEEFEKRYASGEIHDETIVFDPLVNTVDGLRTNFRKPLKESWHARFV